jgi:hypothetical protein
LPGSGDRYQECSAGKHRAQHSIRTCENYVSFQPVISKVDGTNS